MLKSILAFIAMALLVDVAAFGGYYRTQFILEVLKLVHRVVELQWSGVLT
jgi:hypothetical protein